MVPLMWAFGMTLVLAFIHVVAIRFRFLDVVPRSRWLSLSGGASVAYVFLHWLPDLQRMDDTLDGSVATGSPDLVYIVALIGLATFYGLERWAKGAPTRQQDADAVFWVHVSSFAAYNLLIGHVFVVERAADAGTLLLMTLAIGLHLLVVDHGLRTHHGTRYARTGRWLLASSVVVGAAVGMWVELPAVALAIATAWLVGGFILNVLKEELPEERESRFGAFALGVAGYGALLLVV